MNVQRTWKWEPVMYKVDAAKSSDTQSTSTATIFLMKPDLFCFIKTKTETKTKKEIKTPSRPTLTLYSSWNLICFPLFTFLTKLFSDSKLGLCFDFYRSHHGTRTKLSFFLEIFQFLFQKMLTKFLFYDFPSNSCETHWARRSPSSYIESSMLNAR